MKPAFIVTENVLSYGVVRSTATGDMRCIL
jgi:hypothetical protein